MNWNLIVRLSFFGFIMGAVSILTISIFWFTVLWLIIYGACVFVIAKRCTEKYFLNGFMLSMLNMGWATGFHIIFYTIYLTNNPIIELLYTLLPYSEFPRLGMIFMAPVFGAVFGLFVGFFSFLVAKVIGK